ncbi:MAG: TIGR02996 domain-containing protein [Polyangiales bacterium]
MPEDPLLARICTEPGGALEARLVYADQLIERGDPRGTFIAQQCELARTDALDERYAPILASTRRLQSRHASEWLGDYGKRTKLVPAHFTRAPVDRHFNALFVGGFLRCIAMRAEDVAKQWKWLAAREPIEGIELLVGEGLDEKHREIAEAAGVRVLKVSPEGWFTSHSVASVLAWGMPLLRDIDLSRCDLGSTGCQLLSNLETDLGDHFEGYRAPPPFRRGQIERLVLHGCQIGDEGARILAAADTIDGIVELDLGQCRLRERETLEALRESPRLKLLKRLSLAGNNELAGHLGALAAWEVLSRLERVALPQAISSTTLQALFPSPSPALRELDLSSAKELLKTPESAIAVASALTHLDIGSTSVGDVGFARLLAAPSTTRLLELRANGCSLSDKAVTALTKSPLDRLVTLDLSSNKLTDAGLGELATWPGIEHVTHLRIGNNRKVTDAGYEALVRSPRFAPAMLDVGKASDTSIARLRERFGDAVDR